MDDEHTTAGAGGRRAMDREWFDMPAALPIARMRDDATSVLESIDAGHISPARCLADCACHTLALIEAGEAKDAELARLRRELGEAREVLGECREMLLIHTIEGRLDHGAVVGLFDRLPALAHPGPGGEGREGE